MHILNVNSCQSVKTGGGTAERTFQMSRFLAAQKGIRCTTLTLDIELDVDRIKAHAPAIVVVLSCFWKRFYMPFLNARNWKLICDLVEEVDIIHLMSHWGILNMLVYFAARRAKKPYVVCPAGSLALFGRSSWLKRIYNLIVGGAIIQNASAWIAVTAGEIPQFIRHGIPESKICILPNGVWEADFPVLEKSEMLKSHDLSDVPIILFMGRLNPIKGPDLLLKGFVQARKNIAPYHLVFAGPDGGMLSELKKMANNAGISSYVHFLGYLDGDERSATYRHAKLLVVPSRQEAMSIVAIEAGICGTPALVTDQCGFGEIETVDKRLQVEATSKGIAGGLINLLRDLSLLEKIGIDYKKFVSKKYSWDSIIVQYANLFRKTIVSFNKQKDLRV